MQQMQSVLPWYVYEQSPDKILFPRFFRLSFLMIIIEFRVSSVVINFSPKNFYKKNEGYLQTQVGNPDGDDKPNKKFYDPRVWIRAAEESMIKRALESFKALNSANSYNWKVAKLLLNDHQ